MAQTNLVSASVRAVRSANKFIPRRAAINLVSHRYSVEYILLGIYYLRERSV